MAHDGGVAESLVAYWPRLGPCPPNHGPPPSERVRIRVLCLCLSHLYSVSSLHFLAQETLSLVPLKRATAQ